jgi:hypothetical protein
MEQKHINVIRTCLKIQRAFGNEKSKADIEEALVAFDEAVKNNTFKAKVKKITRADGKITDDLGLGE